MAKTGYNPRKQRWGQLTLSIPDRYPEKQLAMTRRSSYFHGITHPYSL